MIHGEMGRVFHPALRFDHGVIGFGHAVPAVVAVHRKVTSADGGDLCAVGQPVFQLCDIGECRFRGHIAPVGDRVQRHRDARIGDGLGSGHDMIQMPVHPAIRDQPHQMRRAACSFDLSDEILQRAVVKE